jgi:hypothetical protein
MALPVADLTATATLILALITLILAAATVALVSVTCAGTRQARSDAKEDRALMQQQVTQTRDDAQREVDLMQRQLDAEHQPLLIEVLPSGPTMPDMGARPNPNIARQRQHEVLPSIEIKFGQREGVEIDPRTVSVRVEGGTAYVSVPLRNVGRGLAIIDPASILIIGVALGPLTYAVARRERVPAGETTRIDVAARYQVGTPIEATDRWHLELRYSDFARRQLTQATVLLGCPDGPQEPWLVVYVDQEPCLASGA